MQTTFKLKLLVFFLLGYFFLSSSSCIHTPQSRSSLVTKKQALTEKLDKMNQKLDGLNAEISKHQSNVSKMKDTLIKSRDNKTQPDMSKLHPIATATGQRTEAYHSSPPWMQALTDEFEASHPVVSSIVMGCLVATNGINRANYIMEITRSNQFIEMLIKERDKIKAHIAETVTELEGVEQDLQAHNSGPKPNITDKNGCFTDDMFVLMENGRKHINDIKAGDMVLTAKEDGQTCVKKVLKNYIYDNDHYYLINKRIKVTGLHRFFTQDGWKKVQDLKAGDEVWTSKEDFQKIKSITRISSENKVYCLGIADNHNFFISNDGKYGFLVHNCGEGGAK